MMGAVKTARARLRAPRALASAALVAVLALSGCSGSPLDRAATIDGRVVSESALHETARQASDFYQTDVAAAQILQTLALTPALNAAALANGQALADGLVETALQQNGIAEPNPVMVDFIRSSAYQQTGIQPDPQVLAETEVELSPRYGTWDAEAATIVEQTPEWITDLAESTEGAD